MSGDSGVSQSAYNDLAALVNQLGSDLADLGAEIADMKGYGEQLAELGGKAAQLRGDVDELLDAMPPEQQHPPVDWPSLTAEDAEREWQALGNWVATVLVGWYRPTRSELPDCWPLHPSVVVELSALRTGRLQAYGTRTNASAALEWHDRWRPNVMRRIAEHVERDRKIADVDGTECRPGQHLQPVERVESAAGQQSQQPLQQGPWSAPQSGYIASAPPASAAGGYRPHDERNELAELRHWWPALQQAAENDVRRRREWEAQQHG